MQFMVFSLAAAIKAGIKGDRILNSLSAEQLQSWAAALRATAKTKRFKLRNSDSIAS
jgi:hypothetical protein